MSALERLTAYLCSNPGSEHMDEEYAAFAARLLRQHAHELAEKIRQEVRTLKADGILEQDKDWAASDAADLIDPDKEA